MSQFKFLQIDEEGFPLSQGLRLQDQDFGKILLQNIKSPENRKVFVTDYENETYILENFDQPFVVQHVHFKNNKWILEFPYELSEELNLNGLTVDEWDRFHGKVLNSTTQSLIPFVFSRKAQADFFNLVTEFDDNGFFVGEKYYETTPYLQAAAEVSTSTFWNQFYLQKDLPNWDLSGAHPHLEAITSQLKINKSRILVLGCGKGHDAYQLSQKGHLVTGVDWSEAAIDEAKNKYGEKENLKFVKADAFNLPERFYNAFDIIFEHTFFCAIDPERRNELIKVWRNCLVPTGYLLAFLFTVNSENQPPFSATEWEYRERLKKYFSFLYWTRLRAVSSRSLGSELVVYAQKLELK